jgi:putative YphP/YqiW family bacilliredoxin
MHDILIQQMRDEVKRVGASELRTAADVDAAIQNSKGTMLVVVNSVCGCAAGISRPALAKAINHSVAPEKLVTVFAGQDKEATERARGYFDNQPPSSPSFALLRDGKLVEMIHRYNIEGHSVDQVTQRLIKAFDTHCVPTEKQPA